MTKTTGTKTTGTKPTVTKLCVAVSGINAIDNPGPGIGIARSLKEDADLDVQIVGLAYDALEPGVYMDWLIDKTFVIPYPSSGGEDFLERLRYIHDACGLDCIIPSLDAELPVYIRYAGELAELGIQLMIPTMSQFRLRSKDRLPELAAEMQVRVPPTRVVQTDEQFAQVLREFGFPVIVKGVFYEAYTAHTMIEAYTHYRALAARWGFPIIVQQLVKGDELNVVGVGDGKGGSLGLVAMKKMSVTTLGKVWSAVSVRNDAMLAAAERFIKVYRWNGPFELECIVSDDELFLIEINPRFPAWTYFAAGTGVNLPARMLRRLCGLPVDELTPYAAGKLFMRYTYEIVTDLDRFRQVVTQGETL